jgi:hypothetical protein
LINQPEFGFPPKTFVVNKRIQIVNHAKMKPKMLSFTFWQVANKLHNLQAHALSETVEIG